MGGWTTWMGIFGLLIIMTLMNRGFRGSIIIGMLFIAIVGLVVFLFMARKKRKSEGKYKPATQELTSPRLQLDNMIKPPPEERLI